MSKYLTTVVESWRADSENEAQILINSAKEDSRYTLTKYSSQFKERTSKGEVVDSYYLVQLTKAFNDPKAPETHVEVEYEVE